MKMSTVSQYIAGVGMALSMLGVLNSDASAQGTVGQNVVILLRLAGDDGADVQIGSCLAARLSQMPDIEIGSALAAGVRFVVDIVTAKPATDHVSASLVIVETFPMEQFRPKFKEGENSQALLTSIQYYTLLRLHELVFGWSQQSLCARIAAEIGDKVLAEEYIERND